MNLKVNNDLKLDVNDQQRFIFKKKQRVQEVFLVTNYEEGFLWPEDTIEDEYKAEDDGKKEEPFIDKKGSASKDKLLMQSILIKGKQIPGKSNEKVFWPKIKGSFIKNSSKVKRKNTSVMRKSVNPQKYWRGTYKYTCFHSAYSVDNCLSRS